MGMPQIPKGEHRPTFDETVIDLLESVALEEMAISHIINAEGEKMQEVIKKYNSNEISYHQVQANCKDTHNMINSLIMKEWLLLTKMNSILEIRNNTVQSHSPPPSPCYSCTQYNHAPYSQSNCHPPDNS